MNDQSLGEDFTAYRYRFGSAEFNEARFELRVAGLVVETERRALEVLVHLLRHAGEVVTKEELFREVWAGRITVDKVLPNAINKLRRALGSANAALIATQARLGYRLDGPVQRIAVGYQAKSEFELKAGFSVPTRSNFVLSKLLSKRTGGEVWLAEHRKTREWRVYKFAADGSRLRSLKREATISRILQESFDDQPEAVAGFVSIIDWNFEQAPFFLESEFGGENLLEWAETHLSELDSDARIALFLQIADAVAFAHSVGVLHKDLKPANVVISRRAVTPANSSPWQVRLTDFGSGRLLESDRLEQLGISRLGVTMTQTLAADDSSGTPLYLAPEVFAGEMANSQSDVYALGVILYQLLSGKLNQPMATGWEQEISDPLLRDDLRFATEGNRLKRLSSAALLGERLRTLAQRRRELEHAETEVLNLAAARAQLDRANTRRPYLQAFVAALMISLAGMFYLQHLASQARDVAESALSQAQAVNQFLNEDLIGQSNPLLLARGQSTAIKDLLLASRDRINQRFANQPRVAASLRLTLAKLFLSIDLNPEAEQEARAALVLLQQEGKRPDAVHGADALRLQSLLARALARQSKFQEAAAALASLDENLSQHTNLKLEFRTYLSASAWSSYHLARGEFRTAVPKIELAIAAQEKLATAQVAGSAVTQASEDIATRDWMRLDLIRALTAIDQNQEAQRQGQTLLAEAKARGQGSELMVALTQGVMARSLSYLGDNQTAEDYLLEAQKVIHAQLGPGHGRSLALTSELLSVAYRSKDFAKAQKYAEEAYQSMLAARGPDEPSSWITLGNVGRILLEVNRDADAQEKLLIAERELLRLSGKDAVALHDVRVLLAFALINLTQLDAAEERLAAVDAKLLENVRGNGKWQASIDGLRGLILLKRGDQTGARALIIAAEKVLRPKTPQDHSDRLYERLQMALQEL